MTTSMGHIGWNSNPTSKRLWPVELWRDFFVVVLHMGEDFISCARILCVVHAQNVYDHPLDDFDLAIILEVESCGLSEIGFQH